MADNRPVDSWRQGWDIERQKGEIAIGNKKSFGSDEYIFYPDSVTVS